MIQEHCRVFKPVALQGVTIKTEMPKLTFENYTTGQYQKQLETFLSENFGFREAAIRLYNQYVWDFYRKTYVDYIIPGKDRWLYFMQNVNDYYGTEMYRWQSTPQEAIEKYKKEARLMNKLRGVLDSYGIKFMMFMAPEKGFLYPEYLPDREFDTVSINARKYYAKLFDEIDFPYIEMTEWFLKIKDTTSFPLYPQTGAHWNFSSVYGADSLFRYMGDLKGIELPKLKIGPLRESSKKSLKTDNDLERTMNLLRPICHKGNTLYEADVTVVADSNSVMQKVLFVGNSFLWRMKDYIPFEQVFKDMQFWYYNSTAHIGHSGNLTKKVSEMDRLKAILSMDYVVWFTSGSQMYKTSYGFVEDALVQLCINGDVFQSRQNEIADSLKSITYYREKYKDILSDTTAFHSKLRTEAYSMLMADPELFKELRGNSIPTARNEKVLKMITARQIEDDPEWMFTMSCQSVIQNISKESVIMKEVDNILNNRPLYRDMEGAYDSALFIQGEAKIVEEEIRSNASKMENIKKKAKMQNKTIDQAIHDDALWIVNHRNKPKIEKKSKNDDL
jgi:hypothetical protein